MEVQISVIFFLNLRGESDDDDDDDDGSDFEI